MTIIPLWDPKLAITEVQRCHDKGAKAVAFSENLNPLGLPSIYSGAWDDFFAVVDELRVPLCTHIGCLHRAHYCSRRSVWRNCGEHQSELGQLDH